MNVVEGITTNSNRISDCNPSQATEKETMSNLDGTATATTSKTAIPATEEDVKALEQRLNSAIEARQATEVSSL